MYLRLLIGQPVCDRVCLHSPFFVVVGTYEWTVLGIWELFYVPVDFGTFWLDGRNSSKD